LYLARGTDGFGGTSLRQGDILAGVPFALMEQGKMHVLGAIAQDYDYAVAPSISVRTHEHRGDRGWVTIQVPARFGLCAVLSNCCDLEPREGRVQAHAVTLARLRPISPDTRNNPENFASLRANRDPRDAVNPGYFDFFYLEPHAQLEGTDWTVHFNQVVTVPTTDIALLLRRKVLQLDDRTRVKFKIKLASSFGRINDDEIDAGLENPWEEPPITVPPA
jgi:hypothetical protein